MFRATGSGLLESTKRRASEGRSCRYEFRDAESAVAETHRFNGEHAHLHEINAFRFSDRYSRMQSTEQLRPEQLVGLVARSAEGTAAKGMPIKGHEDLWVEIQANTFRNWVNEHLKHAGDVGGGPVLDLAEDFRDGTRLCALVEVLTQRRLPRWNPRPANQHHHLENVSTALQAIEADGVKLVNIGEIS